MSKLTNELPQTFDFDNKQVWASDGENTELINFEDLRRVINAPMIGTIERFAGKPDVFVEGGLEYRVLKNETLDNSTGIYNDLLAVWGTLKITPSLLNKTPYFGMVGDKAFEIWNNGNVIPHEHGVTVKFQSQPHVVLPQNKSQAQTSSGLNFNIPSGAVGMSSPLEVKDMGLFFDNAKTSGQTGETADYTCGDNVSIKYYYVSRLV